MSPDNWKSNPVIARYMKAHDNFIVAFPALGTFITKENSGFNGFSMFFGDTAEFIVGLRRFDDDGAPEIIWSSGGSPIDALLNLDKGVRAGVWKVDKKALAAQTK